jgi:hypothetical protein
VWDLPGAVPVVYCEYTYSELRFRRAEHGALRIRDKSRERLLAWASEFAEMGANFEVNQNAPYKARYLDLRQYGAPTPHPVPDLHKIALRIPAEPEWLQEDETPETNGRPMRFLYQARATRFTDYVAGFEIFAFSDRSGREIAYVWQIS